MKRSQIVQELSAEMPDLFVADDDDATANNILTFLESKGMSPPDWLGVVYGYNEGYISPPEWEGEDEDN